MPYLRLARSLWERVRSSRLLILSRKIFVLAVVGPGVDLSIPASLFDTYVHTIRLQTQLIDPSLKQLPVPHNAYLKAFQVCASCA